MTEHVTVLVSYRLRTTGRVSGCPVVLPTGADPHLVPIRDLIAYLAEESGVPAEEIELLDLWSEQHGWWRNTET